MLHYCQKILTWFWHGLQEKDLHQMWHTLWGMKGECLPRMSHRKYGTMQRSVDVHLAMALLSVTWLHSFIKTTPYLSGKCSELWARFGVFPAKHFLLLLYEVQQNSMLNIVMFVSSFSQERMDKWIKVRHCRNIHSTSCNLTCVLPNFFIKFRARVKAVSGKLQSPWVESQFKEYHLDGECLLGYSLAERTPQQQRLLEQIS